jgi:TP901 family phage tail tape measure protein
MTEAEIMDRTNATIKMAQVTGDSVELVSNQLTAVWNNFYDGTKSLEYYADVMTKLGAVTASSTDEISEGVNKFASIASTIGLSYEYAASALATVTATTRESADVVGNAFKTLFARLQGLQLGETLDDGVTLNKYSKALDTIGISLFDTNGQVKEMDELLNELGDRWDKIGKAEQIAFAQTAAGVRQYAQLIALLDNWDTFQENLATSYASEGTLSQ